MNLEKLPFGKTADAKPVELYKLTNAGGQISDTHR
jgi:hypothetical protein